MKGFTIRLLGALGWEHCLVQVIRNVVQVGRRLTPPYRPIYQTKHFIQQTAFLYPPVVFPLFHSPLPIPLPKPILEMS
jgi:hypothetical protein